MQFLGKICRLQVQPTSLKVGDRARRSYDPAGIRVVPTMTITPDGVVGWSDSGERIDDIHNRNHPASKNRGDNPISIGFLSHYDEMRRAYGGHLVDGIAGENILVEHDQRIGKDDIHRGFAIETSAGSLIQFHNVIVATPCVEFSRYAMQFPEDVRPDETVTSTLQFLNDGMRGYYASYSGPEVRVSVGHRVFVLDPGESGSI